MSTKTSPLLVKVKTELPSDEIKDFAETAMNELLGWYGYENVDRGELGRTSKPLGAAVITNSAQQQASAAKPSRVTSQITESKTSSAPSKVHPPTRSAKAPPPTTSSTPDRHTNNSSPEITGSRFSKSPASALAGVRSELINDEKKVASDVECGWCKRPVSLSSPDFLTSPEGPRYCTESCFSQSRRASFKRAKTCDWCKHVRHAVSYVDFLDGASQLQFCSDKCLNQYKMQIFCKETQAHLDMNPHLLEKGDGGQDGALITPELWLKNCKSRSTSPMSDRSRSRSPIAKTPHHKPIITLAPSSKLLSRPALPNPVFAQRSSPKVSRKRRSLRQCSSVMQRPNTLHTNRINADTTTSSANASPATTLQDLTTNAQHRNISNHRMNFLKNASPKSNVTNQQQFLPPPPNLYPIRSPPVNAQPATTFAQSTAHQTSSAILTQTSTTTPSASSPSNESTNRGQPTTHPTASVNTLQPHFAFGANPPPITILVPYPVMVPVPFPIPIPMPIIAFLRAAQIQLDAKHKSTAPTETPPTSQKEPTIVQSDLPLDCTKTRELHDDDDPEHLIEMVCEDSSDSITEIVCQSKANANQTQTSDTLSDQHAAISSSPPSITATSVASTNSDPQQPTSATSGDLQQPLPRFKITRLNSRRGIITPSSTTVAADHVPSATNSAKIDATATYVAPPVDESPPMLETSRPLRKRKRLVDCDYTRAAREEVRKKTD